MAEGGDDVFVINTEEEQVEEAPVAQTAESARETEAEAMEHVRGLIPLCTQHPHGPQLSSATFGYDIAQMAKRPWAEPGAKLSDYFNYGFNEQSWRVYCAMQQDGEDSLLTKASEMLQKLEATGRPANPTMSGVVEEAGAAAGGDPSLMMMGHNQNLPNSGGVMMMEGYGNQPYGGGYGDAGMQRGGFNTNVNSNRPFHARGEFHGGPYGGGAGPNNANYKTRLCKAFAEGHCNRGESCNYAHGVAELRQPGGGAAPAGAQPMPGPGGASIPQQQQQQQQSGQGYGGATFYSGGSAPPPPERTANYLMPPFQAGGALPPMMTQQSQEGEGASGFRQPPKRQRQDGGDVYEPRY